MAETSRWREKQATCNAEHGITSESVEDIVKEARAKAWPEAQERFRKGRR